MRRVLGHLLVWVGLPALTLVLMVASKGSQAGFAGAVNNTTSTAGTRAFFTCQQAEVNTTGAWGAWALGTTRLVGATEPSLVGTHPASPGLSLGMTATANDIGCRRDTPAASVQFTGQTCLVVDSTGAGTAWPTTNFTTELWFKTSTVNTVPVSLLSFEDTNSGTTKATKFDRMTYLDAAGHVVFGVFPGTMVSVSSATTLPAKDYRDGLWHHVVAIDYNTNSMYLFIDGNQVDVRLGASSAAAFTGWWHIGCGTLKGWSGAKTGDDPTRFTGQLQYVAVYQQNPTINAANIMMHYLAGAP